MDRDDWMTCREAADFWNEMVVVPKKGSMCARPVSEQSMRKKARDGTLADMGVDYIFKGGAYLISRSSLGWYVWVMSEQTARRAAKLVGIADERVAEIIGEVGATHAGKGEEMDALWRDLMHHEFAQRMLPEDMRGGADI